MPIPTIFNAQSFPPKQMPKNVFNEVLLLDDSAVGKDGKLWVLYSTTFGATTTVYRLCYRIYDTLLDSWAAEVEVYPDGDASPIYGNYSGGSSFIVTNRNGDMFISWMRGTNAGDAIHKARVIRSDGTKEAFTTVPNGGGNITNAAAVTSNDCYDWTLIDNAGTGYVGTTWGGIRAIDFDSVGLTWGNDRKLYDSGIGPEVYPIANVYRYSASFSPPEQKVHVAVAVKTGTAGNIPYKILHLWDGGGYEVIDIPENLMASTSYLLPFVRLCCDNIDEGRAHMVYEANALLVGPPPNAEINFMDTILYRQIIDYAFAPPTIQILDHTGPPYGPAANDIVIDGTGNVHLISDREGENIALCVIAKFAAPPKHCPGGDNSPFGTSYLRKDRLAGWGASLSDFQEVFFDDVRNPGTASYKRFDRIRTARPFPGHTTLFVAAQCSDEGGDPDAEEGIYINFADVLTPGLGEDGEPIDGGCGGMEPTANDQAHRMFVFDERDTVTGDQVFG